MMPKYGLRDYMSRNPKTGMLEDIEEVRDLGLFFADELLTILQSPVIMAQLSPGIWGELIVGTCIMMGLLEQTSQVEMCRKVMSALGLSESSIRQELEQLPLSQEYAYGDPAAPTISTADLPPIDTESIMFKTSPLLQQIYAKQQQEHPKIKLPADLEEFIKRLEDKGDR